jgi:acetylornithine deacetylase
MNPVELTMEFVSHNSASYLSNVSVTDAMAKRMREAGLKVERIAYKDPNGVPKLNIVGKKGRGTGGLALMGHNDVVPATGWAWDPFKVIKKGSRIYGRGVADMKGSVACMIATAAAFDARKLKRPIYVVVTGDEEINCAGADVVFKNSKVLKESRVRYGIIGEPTLLDVVQAHKGSVKVQRARHTQFHGNRNKLQPQTDPLSQRHAGHRSGTEDQPKVLEQQFCAPTFHA